MLLRERLLQYDFSNSESSIVTYILEHPSSLKTDTIKQLANATYTAPSTFIRIAHKMGFEGWNELKVALMKENEYLETHFNNIDANIPFAANDTIMSIASKIAKLEQESIEDTLSLITHDDLQHALNIIRKADTIHVFAVSNNLYLPQQFAHQMSRIARRVMIHSLQSELVFNAVLARPNDCAIIISYSGETDILINCAKACKDRHIPVIAITNLGENTIAGLSDVILRLCTREKLFTKIANYSVNTSVTYLLDVLYSCVFAEHYDRNFQLKVDTSKLIESGHFSDNQILEEDDNNFTYL